jgi:hypothetical protein
MKRYRIHAILDAAALMVEACSVAHFEIANKLSTEKRRPSDTTYDIFYHRMVASDPRQLTLTAEAHPVQVEKAREQYLQATEEIFGRHACTVQRIESAEDTNFVIAIDQKAAAQRFTSGVPHRSLRRRYSDLGYTRGGAYV